MINNKKKILYYQNLKQKKIYQPTLFWSELVKKNTKFLAFKSLKNFRSFKSTLIGFIPFYSLGSQYKVLSDIKNIGKIIKKKIGNKKIFYKLYDSLIKSVNGNEKAYSQYRILCTDDIEPKLSEFKESFIGKPFEQFYFNKSIFSASSLNYLTGLLFLKKHLKNFNGKVFLEIGGGFGSLGEILYKKFKKIKYINLDLFPQNIVCEYYLQKSCKNEVSDHLKFKKTKTIKIKNLNCLSSLLNSDIEKLNGKIDVFTNFISFQEMRIDVVKNYLYHIKRLKPRYILLRNLREGKQDLASKKLGAKKAGIAHVEKKIEGKEYINLLKSKYFLLDRNTEPYGNKTWDGFHSELLLFKKK